MVRGGKRTIGSFLRRLSSQVKAEVDLLLSEHTKGWKGILEKAAGSGRHTSWLCYLEKGVSF